MNQELEDYIHSHTSEEEEVLNELDRETHQKIYHPRMISGHLQGKLLQMFCRMIRPLKILEIGTYTGYSAISMAFATEPEAVIYTIEKNDELRDFTEKYFLKAGVNQKIKFLTGDAKDMIPEINETFDLIFIDGDKFEYSDYYNLVFPKLRSNGFIIADNVLWSGKVIEKNIKNNDHETKGIIEFNKMIQNDDRVENMLLPMRDGLMIIRKK
jgi:predicted O-methyltransferase YrrM